MSAKTTELKPCPFCGSGNVRHKEAEHAVVCARCKARGSIAPDEEMAIRMWDERAGELKPDSWENLEEDTKQVSCQYFGMDRTPASCDDCPHGWWQTGRPCWQNARLNMIARAKKLAGIEEEAQR